MAPGASQQTHVLPASYAQEQYMLNTAPSLLSNHNLTTALCFHGAVNRLALASALRSFLDRHETLRTSLFTGEHGVRQVIHAHCDVHLVELASPGRSADVGAILLAATERPFHLMRDQLFRLQLLAVDATTHILIVTLHHTITDGWSSSVIVPDELGALYEAACAGIPSPLPSLQLQFADYASWERTVSSPQREAYWRTHLQTPTHAWRHVRSSEPSDTSELYFAESLPALPSATLKRLRALAADHRVSLPLVLVALVVAVVSRYSAGPVTVGHVIANRARSELRGVLGFIADFLPFRVDVPPDASLGDLIQRVRVASDAAYKHQLPYGAIHEFLNPSRSWSVDPCCDVLVNYLDHGTSTARTVVFEEAETTITSVNWSAPRPPRIFDTSSILPAPLEVTSTLTESGQLLTEVEGARQTLSPDVVHDLAGLLQVYLNDLTAPSMPPRCTTAPVSTARDR